MVYSHRGDVPSKMLGPGGLASIAVGFDSGVGGWRCLQKKSLVLWVVLA